MQEVILKVYSFTELAEDIQKKVIEKNRYIEVQFNNWYEGTTEDFISTSEEKGFKATKTYFTGFSSQGDGAMFEYDGIEDFLLHEFIDEQKTISPMRKKWFKSQAVVSGKGKHQGHYHHEGCCYHNIYLEFKDSYSVAPNIADWIGSFDEEFERFIISRYQGIAKELYRDLEKDHDNLISDESVKEGLIANENSYTQEGKNVNDLV